MNEFKLIDYIKNRSAARINVSRSNKIIKGIGDDTAVVKTDGNTQLLITTDSLIENVHFSLKTTDLYNLGYKSVIVNVSDILSKGGNPKYLLGSINIPAHLKNIKRFIDGVNDCCEKYNIKIIGGDTTSSKNDFCISITLIGETSKKTVFRNGSLKENSLICMTGYAGLSGAGFYALNDTAIDKKKFSVSVNHHIKPELPDFRRYAEITERAIAGMDNSDGLYFSVCEICENSGCGCELNFDKIPIHSETLEISQLKNIRLEALINFGEDYNFVGVFPESSLKFLNDNADIISIIGKIKKMPVKNLIYKNRKIKLRKKGFVHK